MSFPGFKFEFDSGGMIVRVTGRAMIEQKEAAIQAIAAAIDAQPLTATLVDLRFLEPPYSFMDRYQLGELTAKHLTKTPIAALAQEIQIDEQRIGQLVAANRGAHFEVFTDEAAAMAWLRSFAKA